MAHVKWFPPDGSWTWFVTEYYPDTQICFGLVEGLKSELGYFSLAEIKAARTQLGLSVERDLHWQPMPLSEIGNEIRHSR